MRKVSSAGIITTVANVSAHGLTSDGKNVFIADPFKARVLELTPDGTLTTLAGNGTYGHANGSIGGDFADAIAFKLGNKYVAVPVRSYAHAATAAVLAAAALAALCGPARLASRVEANMVMRED